MRWASAVSQRDSFSEAAAEAAGALADRLHAQPDLVLMFSTGYARVDPSVVREALGGNVRLVGCTTSGVIGGGQEVQQASALSLVGAVLPDVTIEPFHLDPVYTPRFANDIDGWRRRIPVSPEDTRCMLVFPDPFTADSQLLLAGIDAAFPGVKVLGGLAASGGPGQVTLCVDDQTYQMGCVGVALGGRLAVETLVAQGCRPIGRPMMITASEEHFILELEKRRALDVLNEIFRALTKDEQKRFARSLVVGVEMNEESLEYRPNQLLVRNVQGVDPESGAISVGAYLEPHQVVQFMVRDAAAAEADLVHHLEQLVVDDTSPPDGALMFACLNRGETFFGAPNHDSDLLQRRVGKIPVGGFFSNGEIGPVGGKTFVHGYTSSFGLFRST